MFRERFISACVLIPLVLLALFYAPIWVLKLVLLVILILAWKEACQLIPLHTVLTNLIFLIALFFSLWLVGHFFQFWLIIGLGLWFLIFLAILSFPYSQRYWGFRVIVYLLCCLVLSLFIQCLAHLYTLSQGKALILYLFFLIWTSDSGAYLVGKLWGKHKLIAKVSPGKTWEGSLGGLILTLIVAYLSVFYFHPPAIIAWLFLALVIAVVAIFGDLFISILKRRCNLKDTGLLIPGHGGILDRLDSLIAALPFFYVGVKSLC